MKRKTDARLVDRVESARERVSQKDELQILKPDHKDEYICAGPSVGVV